LHVQTIKADDRSMSALTCVKVKYGLISCSIFFYITFGLHVHLFQSFFI